MSCWTHITACLSIDTNIIDKKPQVLKQVNTYLENAPKITGSESNATIFVNMQKGYNIAGSDGKFQTCVVISIQGDLRDRTQAQTQQEFYTFFNYVRNKYHVRDYAMNIESDY